uniref:uncharacterized protein LOC108950143 isoform X1 n=1 Tax=Ciona intestinalis TaxID=7719 RepID=UPI00089DD280|nr:uncharacterized protein LOC108950143 isoform X1 [Ciona intestinalis]|eukprot:XP_018670520.1 uncharacterized protein LOC108950143 isoform X1 [Ciona intestinalis]
MDAILEKMASFEEMFLQLKNKQEEYESSSKINSNESDTASPVVVVSGSPELKEMHKMLTGLETSLKDLTALVKRTDDRLDDLEQYGRRNCLIIHGNRRVPGERNNFLRYVLNILNKLHLPYPVTPADIDIAHVLPTKKDRVPIIIKFVRRMVRNDVYAQKRNLKGTGMAMTESLTSRRLQIVEKAKASFGFRNVWTANGTIYVTHNNKRKWG